LPPLVLIMLETYGFLVLGLVLVTLGADSFVKGASGLAQGQGVGGFSAGLAMVAVGASTAQVAIAAAAIFRGHDALAIGTVLGGCIANLGLIIGVSALVKPLAVGFRLLAVALPILVVAVVALWIMGADGAVGRFDGSLLLLAAVAFGWLVRRAARQESESVRKELAYAANTQSDRLRNLLRIAIGLAVLGYGAWRSVGSALEIAAHFRMDEMWIGLSVLAIGAALPELASAVVAAARGHGNVVVGSALASSVVNLLFVLVCWHCGGRSRCRRRCCAWSCRSCSCSRSASIRCCAVRSYSRGAVVCCWCWRLPAGSCGCCGRACNVQSEK